MLYAFKLQLIKLSVWIWNDGYVEDVGKRRARRFGSRWQRAIEDVVSCKFVVRRPMLSAVGFGAALRHSHQLFAHRRLSARRDRPELTTARL